MQLSWICPLFAVAQLGLQYGRALRDLACKRRAGAPKHTDGAPAGPTLAPELHLWLTMPISRPAPPPPAAAHDLEHVAALFARLGLAHVVRPIPARIVWAAYVFVNGFIAIAILALVAVITRVPFIFPSLGPTAYLLFFLPRSDAASPHNTVIGHAIGLMCGYAAFWLMGSPGPPTAATSAFDWPRIMAAALSLAATGALMIVLNASHPPAGATTLIVSLGIISKPPYLAVIEAAVVILTIQAFCINRLAGVPYPVWKNRRR